jgi:hypothetical protein
MKNMPEMERQAIEAWYNFALNERLFFLIKNMTNVISMYKMNPITDERDAETSNPTTNNIKKGIKSIDFLLLVMKVSMKSEKEAIAPSIIWKPKIFGLCSNPSNW